MTKYKLSWFLFYETTLIHVRMGYKSIKKGINNMFCNKENDYNEKFTFLEFIVDIEE